MEELVKEADAIVAKEIEERRKQREAEMSIPEEDEESVNAIVTDGEDKVEEGEEVSSN